MPSQMKNVIPAWFCHLLFHHVFALFEICALSMNMICEARKNTKTFAKIIQFTLKLHDKKSAKVSTSSNCS